MHSFDTSPKSKVVYINREVQTTLNEANSNFIDENSILKSKLNKFKCDQVYFEENPKVGLMTSYGILKSLFEYVEDSIKKSKVLTTLE